MRLSSVCLACTLVAVPLWAVAAPRAVYLGTYQIPDRVEYLGGFSGLEFSDDGKSFVALSDSAALASGTVTRDERGAITGVSFDGPPVRLKDAKGALLTDPEDDSEGLAFAPDGSLYLSFELMNRVAKFGRDGVLIETLPVPREFYGFEYNAGPEALAIAPDGAIFTLPEGDAGGMTSDPMFRFQGGVWDVLFKIGEDATWRPVGADFGPDGRLYLLERDFWPLVGFKSRLRLIGFDEGGVTSEETLFETQAGLHGNLEGLSIWADTAGAVHATMITDNNFLAIQDSAFVDYRIED